MFKVEGEPDLIRDSSGVIKNVNRDEYMAYIARRNAMKAQQERLDRLEKESGEMRGMLTEILQILKGK